MSIFGQFTEIKSDVLLGWNAMLNFVYHITYFSHHRELTDRPFQSGQNGRNWSSNQFFVFLCEFSADRYLAVSRYSLEFSERGFNPVWRLKEDHRPPRGSNSLEPLRTVF